MKGQVEAVGAKMCNGFFLLLEVSICTGEFARLTAFYPCQNSLKIPCNTFVVLYDLENFCYSLNKLFCEWGQNLEIEMFGFLIQVCLL